MQKIAALFHPLARVAFAAMVIAIPFRLRVVLLSRPVDTIYKDYTDFVLFAPDAFMVATIAFWVVLLALEKGRVNFGPFFISIPLAGLTLAAIVTSFFSLDPALSFYHSLRLVLLDALYLFIVNELHSLTWVTVPLATQLFVQAGIGIAQFYQQHSVGLQWLGEYELDPKWSGVSVVFADGMRVLRAYGLADHPNILGGCLAFAMILRAARFGEARPRAKILTAIVFTLGAAALLFTFSRAAYGAFAMAMAFVAFVLWQTQQIEWLKQFALLLGIAAIFVLPIAWENANALGVRTQGAASATAVGLEIRSIAERTALNQAANRIFNDRPMLGTGIGALPKAMQAYYPNFDFYYQPAHIVLLDVAAETGIFGALLYFSLMVAPWIALGVNRKKLNWTPALIGTSAVLLAINAIGLFDYYTWLLVPGRLWQWTVWGLWSTAFQNSMTK